MSIITTHRPALLGTTALVLLLTQGTISFAQESTDGFLGTILLGESKREVQTQTATAVTEIGQEEMEDRQASTVAELIDSVPGVSLVNGSTPNGSGINIRGYGANGTYGTDSKVAVQVDGASVGGEELYRLGNQSFTDPALYKSISVIRGTVGSFEYGSGIVGGVVQMQTRDASDFTGGEPGFRLRQTLQYSSNGDGVGSSTILAWQPTENLEFLANYIVRKQSDMVTGNGLTIGSSEFDTPSWLAKAKYTFGNDRNMSLTFSVSDTNSDDKDVPYDMFQTTGGAFGNVDREVHSRTAVLAYNYNPAANDLVDLDVNLSYADQKIDQEYVAGSSSCEGPGMPCGFPFPVGGFGSVNADHRYETTKLTIKNASLFTTGAMSHNLRTGVEFVNKKRLDASAAPGGTDKRFALFAVDEIDIGDHWTVTPALRYERQKIQGTTAPLNQSYNNEALMGGLSARYAFANGFAVFGSAAYTESLPIIDDLDKAEQSAFMTQSEKARTFELGFSYDGTGVFTSDDTFGLKANIYKTSLWDVTSGGTTIAANPYTIDTQGVEIEASYAMDTGLYVDMNLNVADGAKYYVATGRFDWSGTPANSVRLTVGKKFNDEFDLSWEMMAAASITEVGTGGTKSTSGYAVHNLRATYAPQSGFLEGAEIRVGIENVFDRDYTPHLSTRPAPGRNIKLTLAKTF